MTGQAPLTFDKLRKEEFSSFFFNFWDRHRCLFHTKVYKTGNLCVTVFAS